ncbi:transposable element Tcb2 transposase [Trichonephila clavipes]|nr:transposable element Tcb2 transposase [Trichonephila clavipes]
MGAEFLFMDDNARLHRVNIVDECLQSEDITRMDWPAYSPDLNPIEHIGSRSGFFLVMKSMLKVTRTVINSFCGIQEQSTDATLRPDPCPLRQILKAAFGLNLNNIFILNVAVMSFPKGSNVNCQSLRQVGQMHAINPSEIWPVPSSCTDWLSIEDPLGTSFLPQWHNSPGCALPSQDAFSSYTRAFGDGPRNFEPWTSDVDDT